MRALLKLLGHARVAAAGRGHGCACARPSLRWGHLPSREQQKHTKPWGYTYIHRAAASCLDGRASTGVSFCVSGAPAPAQHSLRLVIAPACLRDWCYPKVKPSKNSRSVGGRSVWLPSRTLLDMVQSRHSVSAGIHQHKQARPPASPTEQNTPPPPCIVAPAAPPSPAMAHQLLLTTAGLLQLLLLLAGWRRPPLCAAVVTNPCLLPQLDGGESSGANLYHTFWAGALSNHHLLAISSLLNTQSGPACIFLWTRLPHVETSADWLRRHALADAVYVRVFDEFELAQGTLLEGNTAVFVAAALDDEPWNGSDMARVLVLNRQACGRAGGFAAGMPVPAGSCGVDARRTCVCMVQAGQRATRACARARYVCACVRM